MNFVLDCSLTLSWCLEDESNPYADQVQDSFADGSHAFVPQLWMLEVLNVLLISERRQRITQNKSREFISYLKKLPIQTDPHFGYRSWDQIWQLAKDLNLTAYDAAYLELALRNSLPLATLDNKLREAASKSGLPPFTPDSIT